MALNRSYAEYALELLRPFGQITGRAMFGGFGIWERGQMFALLDAESTLYFKTSQETEAEYREAGAKQFAPQLSGKKPMPMPYWSVPAEVLDGPDELERFAKAAIRVAHASAKPKKAASVEAPKGAAAKEAPAEPASKRKESAAAPAKERATSKPASKKGSAAPVKQRAAAKPATKPAAKKESATPAKGRAATKPAAKRPARAKSAKKG